MGQPDYHTAYQALCLALQAAEQLRKHLPSDDLLSDEDHFALLRLAQAEWLAKKL